eukprot:COSAG04_NODE_1569_length_6310_cov_6.835614_3_plen_74_part_00
MRAHSSPLGAAQGFHPSGSGVTSPLFAIHASSGSASISSPRKAAYSSMSFSVGTYSGSITSSSTVDCNTAPSV